MPSIDMPLSRLRDYKPELNRQGDFDSFWSQTIGEALSQPLKAELTPYPLKLRGLDVFEVRFDGFGGGRIAGWYVCPSGGGRHPAVMMYHGYSGRAPRPLDLMAIASQGFAVMSMDCRGQNGRSEQASSTGGHASGWMTQGIGSPQTYYYRYVYADAVRALEVLAGRGEVDASRIAVAGGSQGGGLSLAAAALSSRPVLAFPDIPFLCDFRRAIDITPTNPYLEFTVLFKIQPELYETALRTLSYFDCMNLAPRITARTIISNGLQDDVCPPSTIFAVYNHLTCEKQMEVYPFHKHEVPYEHMELRMKLLLEVLKP